MNSITLVRGLPGSGKSTFAENHGGNGAVYSTDDYFMRDGKYDFDGSQLKLAHAWNQLRVETHLKENISSCIVANTFSQRWEMEPYIKMAKEYGYRLFVVDLFDNGCTDEELFARNEHSVPLGVIKGMRMRWQHDWRNGNAAPPAWPGRASASRW